eukprot:gene3236-5946_t
MGRTSQAITPCHERMPSSSTAQRQSVMTGQDTFLLHSKKSPNQRFWNVHHP